MLGLCWPLVVGWLMWLCVLVMCNVLLDGAIELGALCWWLQSAIVTQMYELLSYFQKAIRGDLPRFGALQVVLIKRCSCFQPSLRQVGWRWVDRVCHFGTWD